MILDAALALVADRRPIFALNGKLPVAGSHGFADATLDQDRVYYLLVTENVNFGIPTGAASRWWVLDVDPRHGGDKSLAELERKYGPLPRTREVLTGTGGRHLYWEFVEGLRNTAGKAGPGLDTRGEGGYVVGHTSIHPITKQRYVLVNDIPAVQAPEWLIQLVMAPPPPPKREPDDADQGIPEGQRNAHLASLAGTLRRRGCSYEVIFTALEAENASHCKPPLSEREVANIAGSVSRYEPAPAPPPRPNGQPPPVTVEDVKSEPLITVTEKALYDLDIPLPGMLLDPVIPEHGLSMLYSFRGIGKTYVALGMAAALTSGGKFLRWKANKPVGVLYVDGELISGRLKKRMAFVRSGMDIPESGDGITFITRDFQKDRRMPDLATLAGQHLIEDQIRDNKVVILDNLSCLIRSGKENEGEDWLPVQEWCLSLRSRGISPTLVHHAGKSGAQRGTSRREDPLDIVITLKHPADYNASEGLRCEVHFEKSRDAVGDLVAPFEIRLGEIDGHSVWTTQSLEEAREDRAAEMFSAGMSVKDVAAELGISRATAFRIRKKLGLSREYHHE